LVRTPCYPRSLEVALSTFRLFSVTMKPPDSETLRYPFWGDGTGSVRSRLPLLRGTGSAAAVSHLRAHSCHRPSISTPVFNGVPPAPAMRREKAEGARWRGPFFRPAGACVSLRGGRCVGAGARVTHPQDHYADVSGHARIFGERLCSCLGAMRAAVARCLCPIRAWIVCKRSRVGGLCS